jgi:hypothetical protein
MSEPLRAGEIVRLADERTAVTERVVRTLARTQRFTVERISAGETGTPAAFASTTEILLLLPDAPASIEGTFSATAPARTIAILPAGEYSLSLSSPGEAYVLATDRTDGAASDPINAASYDAEDERVRPVGPPYAGATPNGGIRVYAIEDITIPPDNGRLRFLQSETMSINWVEYSGTRGRNALSPHAHRDFEQASLALAGDFIHHLRTPWGRNADLWREDQHVQAGAGTMLVIPPEIIHTSEGVGDGLHILVDIFAPPREDFIERRWIHNAADYARPIEA